MASFKFYLSVESNLDIQLQANDIWTVVFPFALSICDVPKPVSKTLAAVRILPSVVEEAIELLSIEDDGDNAAAVRSIR